MPEIIRILYKIIAINWLNFNSQQFFLCSFENRADLILICFCIVKNYMKGNCYDLFQVNIHETHPSVLKDEEIYSNADSWYIPGTE